MSQFEAKYDEFSAMGAQVVAVSVDSHFSHRAFADKLGLSFPLLSDFERKAIPAYTGYFDEVAGYREVGRRAVFVIDPSRVIRWAWLADKPADVPDGELVREAIQEVVG
ncbi:MAG: redoxin domain-containing protein [Actinomycetota bacterium]|nr:redoxin domain-containing protein [Actinomycetota bacterium]